MTDVLIRDVPDGVLAGVDARARRLGLSRVEYIRRVEDRAAEVQMALAARGKHRAPSIPDLIVAAIGELAGLVVLHVDKDFDLIADITGQRCERLRI